VLSVKLDEKKGIAILTPEGELTEDDFRHAAKIIDPYIEKSGELNGIVIRVKSFPGWDSFQALISHMKFIKEHHKRVSHVAFVTDSPVGGLAEHITGHFVSAEIKSFSYDELERSIDWILQGTVK